MEISIFDIPLLTDGIAQYLHTRDLFNCVLVSKEWRIAFTPRLWRSIVIERDIASDTLVRHQGHVRFFSGINNYLSNVPRRFYPHNLQSLSHDDEYFCKDISTILQLAGSAIFLQSLSIKTHAAGREFEEQLISTVECHQGLKKLDLENCEFSYDSFLRLTRACRHLHSLSIDTSIGGFRAISALETQVTLAKDFIHKTGDTQHREFSINLYCGTLDVEVSLALLEHSPLLERLKVSGNRSSSDEDILAQITHILRSKVTLVVRIDTDHTTRSNTEEVQEMFQTPWSCVGLKKVVLNIAGFVPQSPLDGNIHLEYLISQTGRLSDLEEFSFETSAHILTQEYGFLDRLTELKRLRILDLGSYNFKISVEEVEWMLDYWTKLGHLIVRECNLPGPVIEVLRSKRPWIQIGK
ncbi:hypothetical protein BGX26_001030 [Mortierella sp. AD094]|nr:hypothetical protein BGX26_001030 [Mortierella sp. AD094]